MAKSMVVFNKCGNLFDAHSEGYYNRKTQQYICPSCENKLIHSSSKGSRISMTADMLFKLYFGIALVLIYVLGFWSYRRTRSEMADVL